MLQSRLITRQALEAVVLCNATPEAYRAIEAAGYHELFPGCIYRDEAYMAIAASTAKEIITQAKKDETHEGPMPETDAEAIKVAEELIEMAEQAWSQNVRGPEVERILKLAAKDQNGGDPGEASSEEDQPPQSSSEQDTPSSETTSSGGNSDSGFFSDLPDKLKKAEPYEGYGDDPVQTVTEVIHWYLDDPEAGQTDEQKRELLQNVWAYEKAHKDRSRILKFITEAAEKRGWLAEPEQEADEAEATPEPEPESSSDNGVPESQPESETEEADQTPATGSEPSGEADSEGGKEKQSAYMKLVELVDKELSRERLDIPKPPTDDVPELPWRWAEVTDEQLANFYMQFAALAYYKGYVRSREDRLAFHCRQAADEIRAKVMVEIDKYDAKGKQKTQTLVDAEAESQSAVKRWRKAQKRHEAIASNARQERDGYLALVESLSRLESMRHQSWERSRH